MIAEYYQMHRAEDIGLASLLRAASNWSTKMRIPVTQIHVDFGDDNLSRSLLKGATLYGIRIGETTREWQEACAKMEYKGPPPPRNPLFTDAPIVLRFNKEDP